MKPLRDVSSYGRRLSGNPGARSGHCKRAIGSEVPVDFRQRCIRNDAKSWRNKVRTAFTP